MYKSKIMRFPTPLPSSRAGLSHILAVSALLCLLFATSVLFGGTWPLWRYLFPCMVALVWLGASLSSGFRQAEIPLSYQKHILVPVFVCMAWGVVQVLPIPFLAHPAYALVTPQLWPALSADVPVSAQALCMGVAMLMLALAAFLLCRNRAVASLLLRGIAIIGLVVAAYGLGVFVEGNSKVLWLPKFAYPESLTATFINRNHYATFAGLTLLACLALFLERAGEISSRLPVKERLRGLWHLVVRPRWYWLLGAALAYVTLILSASRAGIFATGVGVVSMLLALAYARRALRLPILVFLAGGLLLSLAAANLAGDTLGSRLTDLSDDHASRSLIFRHTRQAIAEKPLTGHGVGQFETTFSTTLQQPSSLAVSGKIDHAHNTYLETAANLGLPAALLLAYALLACVVFLAQGVRRHRRSIIWPALGLGVLALTGVHATVDFSLSIPAVAATAAALVGAALARSISGEGEAPLPQKPQQALAVKGLLVVLALPVCALSGWQSWACVPLIPAENTIRMINRGYFPKNLSSARAAYHASARRFPWNSTTQQNLARLDFALSPPNSAAKKVLLAAADTEMRKSLALNPANAENWYRIALISADRGHFQVAEESLENSISQARYEQGLAIRRVPLILFLYPNLQPIQQALYAEHVETLWSQQSLRWSIWQPLMKDPVRREVLRQILAGNEKNAESWQKLAWHPLAEPISPNSVNGISPSIPTP